MNNLFYRAEVLEDVCKKIPSILQDVQFHGVTNTKVDALIKEISELYNIQNLDDLVKRSFVAAKHMQQMGLFENCVPTIDTSPKNNHSYTVNFYVKEFKSFNIGIKLGMTMNGDADANIIGAKKNIFGCGECAELSYTKTVQGGNSFDFNALKPFLGWQKYSNVKLGLLKSFDSLQWNKADLTQNAFLLQFNNQYRSCHLLHSLKLLCSWRFFNVKSDTPFPVCEHAGHTSKISFENVVSFDTRDRPLLASRGLLLRLTNEYAGLVGDSAFFKSQIDAQAATKLFLGLLISASLKFSMIHGLAGRSIHLLDRVYLGGPHDIRGFNVNSIGTRAETASLGGAFGCAAALHLYKSLIPVNMLYGHLFITGGGVSSVRSRHWVKDVWQNPRLSTGVGLTFIFRNVIRLEMNYAVPIWRAADDFCNHGFQFGAGIDFL